MLLLICKGNLHANIVDLRLVRNVVSSKEVRSLFGRAFYRPYHFFHKNQNRIYVNVLVLIGFHFFTSETFENTIT